MKKLHLAKFISIEAFNSAKVEQYKQELDKISETNPDNEELNSFIKKVNGKTMSHFISVAEMNATKAAMYDTFITESDFINWD